MKNITYILSLLLFTLFSCSNKTEFDISAWKKSGSENITLDSRYNMIEDLISSKLLINKTLREADSILNYDRINLHFITDTNKIYYKVQDVYGQDIDPEEVKYIEVILNKNKRIKSISLKSTK